MDAPAVFTTVNKLRPSVYQELLAILTPNVGRLFPAVALAIFHEGERVLAFGCGEIDPTQPFPHDLRGVVTPETRFDLASLTKLFTTTAFLAQVSAGRVALDDPLVRVIPEFGRLSPRPVDGGQDPHSKIHLPTPSDLIGVTVDPAQVTFRHLLTHTSGLPAWRDVYKAAGEPPTPPDVPDPLPQSVRWSRALEALCSYPFVAPPGDSVRYSDIGLMLLGEAATRLNYAGDFQRTLTQPAHLGVDMLIHEKVCERLDLITLGFNPVRNGIDRMHIAPTEDDPAWRGRRVWGEVHDENACGVGGVAGHAGLFGTAAEVARFGQAWLSRDPRLKLDPALMNDAVREQAVTDSERRGLGWMLKSPAGSSAGDRFSANSYGHTGFTGTSLWIDPQRALVVALLTNRVYYGRERDFAPFHALRRAVHDAAAGVE